MTPRPVFKPTSKKAQAMRSASMEVLAEGQLHRATVAGLDQAGGYQPPAEAPQPVFGGPPPVEPEVLPASPPPSPEPLIPEPEDEDEPPALIFDLPTRRRRGKISDDNYQGTSLRIHKALHAWAREVKAKDGWDLADLVNLGLSRLKAGWEDPNTGSDI